MEIERKTFDAAQFKAVDATQGIAEMFVSVFHNVDGAAEVVMPGFFAESIAQRRTADGRPRAKGVWGHDWTTPIAKTLDAKELLPGDPMLPPSLVDLGGLWVRGQFNLETQRGREAFSDLAFGAIDEFSIGYRVLPGGDRFDPQTGVRYLLKGEWFEWSPVLVGMNPDTVLMGVKAAESKPLPNEHACRLRDPDDFQADSFRRTTRKHEGKTYAVITGKLKNEDTMTEQAYRYPTAEWTADEAKAHCKGHDGGTFEPASDKGDCLDCRCTYSEHGDRVLADVRAFLFRAKDLSELRAKEGRVLSAANRRKLQTLLESLAALDAVRDEITELLASTDSPDKSPKHNSPELSAVLERLQAFDARYRAILQGST